MMNVARTAVQVIYENARYKLADAIMHQKVSILTIVFTLYIPNLKYESNYCR